MWFIDLYQNVVKKQGNTQKWIVKSEFTEVLTVVIPFKYSSSKIRQNMVDATSYQIGYHSLTFRNTCPSDNLLLAYWKTATTVSFSERWSPNNTPDKVGFISDLGAGGPNQKERWKVAKFGYMSRDEEASLSPTAGSCEG